MIEELNNLMNKTVELEKADKGFFKEWFSVIQEDHDIKEFCNIMIKKRSRLHKDWAFDEMIKL